MFKKSLKFLRLLQFILFTIFFLTSLLDSNKKIE